MKKTSLITMMAIYVAIGTIGSQLLWFPTGIAKAFPVQHAINVMAAVTLGPVPAVVIAFAIGLLRNLLGIGTLLAFPGGMIGALLAGLCYRYSGRIIFASIGEIIGTGVLASLFVVPYAYILMDTTVGAFAFLPGFLISSISGSLIGLFILSKIKSTPYIRQVSINKS